MGSSDDIIVHFRNPHFSTVTTPSGIEYTRDFRPSALNKGVTEALLVTFRADHDNELMCKFAIKLLLVWINVL